MDRWLTTGQMIDRLKVGEVAECVEGLNKGAKVYHSGEYDSDHLLVRDSRNGLEKGLHIKNYLSHSKWRILPNYVSFEVAMKALKEGEAVTFHFDDGKETFDLKLDWYAEEMSPYTMEQLLNGKWTIED